MGNNAAFTTFEATVLSLYDQGALTPEALAAEMEPYRGSDIDSGGMLGTLSKDGLDVEEIVLKVFDASIPDGPKLPKDYKSWTEEDHAVNKEYYDRHSEALSKITYDRFGWR